MTEIQLTDKRFELFIPEHVIAQEIGRVAGEIRCDMEGKNPVFICVLNGAFMFAAELIKQIEIPCEIGFIRLQSYNGTESSGQIKEIRHLAENIAGRHVVIVEDIIDTGRTMTYLMARLTEERPAGVKIACMLFKPAALETGIKPDYCAMEIPNDFIVGYGLDYNRLGRNLRDIYKIKA
jgi:hypoxanthine phosphoribosyltransferase